MSNFDDKHLEKIKEKADKGSTTAIQMLKKIEREQKLQAKKEEYMGKAMFSKPEDNKEAVKELPVMPVDRSLPTQLDDLDISEIDAYIQKGEFTSLPEHMTVYLKWMEEAHDWYYKFKSRNWVMRYLIANCQDKEGNHISYYMAEKIFNDMLSFFYADKNFKRNSWLRYLSERLEMGAALALDDNDFETYGKNLERAAKVAGMIEVDKSDIDPRLLDRRPRFFVTSPKELGVPKINKHDLARQIDEMELSEAEKQKAKQDLGVEERGL